MTNGHIMPTSHHPPRLHGDGDDVADAQMDDLLDEACKYHPNSPKVALRCPAPEQHLPPVILVEGFFSFFNEVRNLITSFTPRPYCRPNNRLNLMYCSVYLSVFLGPHRGTSEC